MHQDRIRVFVKPHRNLVPGAGLRDIDVGYQFYTRDKHYGYDYRVKAIEADGIIVSYQGSSHGENVAGDVKLKWKPPLSVAGQNKHDQSHYRYLNTRFSSIRKIQDKARIAVKPNRDMAPNARTVDVQAGSQFFRREKQFGCDYAVKAIEADGIVFRYIEFKGGNDATGSVKLQWKP